MCQHDGDSALLMPLVDMPVGLDGLLQGIDGSGAEELLLWVGESVRACRYIRLQYLAHPLRLLEQGLCAGLANV